MSRASAKLVMLNGWNRYGVLLTLGQAGAPSLGCILTKQSTSCTADQLSTGLALGGRSNFSNFLIARTQLHALLLSGELPEDTRDPNAGSPQCD